MATEIFVLRWRDRDGERHQEWFTTFSKALQRMRRVDPDGGIVTAVTAPAGKRAVVAFLNEHASG